MNINIAEHFNEAKKKHLELVSQAKSTKEKLAAEIARKTEAKPKLKADKKQKETLLREAEKEGLDGSKLRDKIRELDLQIAQIVEDLRNLQQQEQESDGVVCRSFEREDL